MFYSFSELSLNVTGFESIPTETLSPFRSQASVDPDFLYMIHLVEALPPVSGEIVYQKAMFPLVFRSRESEQRLFLEHPSRNPYALLTMDFDSGERTLYLRKDFTERYAVSEQNILNCLALENALSLRDRFVLHASFIRTERGAILFSAPSGTGKSTQANLWNLCTGAEILNGDRTCLFRVQNVWHAGGVPWCGTSGIMKNESVPLRAIVLLHQAPENRVSVPGPLSSIRALLEQLTVNPWDSSMLRRAQCFLADLCSCVPSLCLDCRPDREAVEVLDHYLQAKHI